MKIREAEKSDFNKILKLYSFLHDDENDIATSARKEIWETIMSDLNHHIIVAEENDNIVASCVFLIVPNLSRGGKPYALIENVVTNRKYRRKGYATNCLNYAKELAKTMGCYKIMLLTGHKEESILNFYRKAGYNSEDKTAFIQWF